MSTYYYELMFYLVITNQVCDLNASIVEQFARIAWCGLNCPEKVNAYCRYNGSCNIIAESGCSLQPIKKYEILRRHNEFRNSFALGQRPESGRMTLSNMMQLEWDDDLAILAQCSLKDCQASSTGTIPDSCVKTPKFYGIQTVGSDTNFNCSPDMWFKFASTLTAQEFKAQSVSYAANIKSEHQIVYRMLWANTTHVGCAQIRTVDHCVIACNYGQRGEIIGTSAYLLGKPASACPPQSRGSEKYKGLCEKITHEDVYYDEADDDARELEAYDGKSMKSRGMILKNYFIVLLICMYIN